jgi:hypothetical protein
MAYQWLKSVISNQWSVVSGATNSVFSLQPLALDDAGAYYCVITNIYGSTTSAVATLTVTNEPVNLPPLVSLISPTNGAVFRPGTNITITASAADPDGPTPWSGAMRRLVSIR